jgi:hypothetical protein
MTEQRQGADDNTKGHVRASRDQGDDTEGHVRARQDQGDGTDDAEGHAIR